MIARKRPLRRTRLRAKSPTRSRIEKELNALCRRLVVELRDRNTCQRCGATASKIDWAHVFTRNHKRLQWTPENSLGLCAGCHMWFDRERFEGWEWFHTTWPGRADSLIIRRGDRSPKWKIDHAAIKLWLEQELAKYGG